MLFLRFYQIERGSNNTNRDLQFVRDGTINPLRRFVQRKKLPEKKWQWYCKLEKEIRNVCRLIDQHL